MKKQKDFALRSLTDMKIFILFLLDNIGYPIDYTTVCDIVAENTDDLSINLGECMRELADAGHLYYDEVDGESYYMISDTGRTVAAGLYDNLDPDFRERSLRCAIKHISLSRRGAKIHTSVEPTEGQRYAVTLEAQDANGQLMRLTLEVASRAEAENIRRNFEAKPDSVYRGVLFSATGRIEYIS